MDIQFEILLIARTLLATILGCLIGWEREMHKSPAGVRTYGAVALGACTFGLISSHVAGVAIDTRIAAGVVAGVGFLGAGMIMKGGNTVSGLTTAATIWATAGMGLAVSFGMYVLGTLTAILIYFLLALHHFKWYNKYKERAKKKHLHDDSDDIEG